MVVQNVKYDFENWSYFTLYTDRVELCSSVPWSPVAQLSSFNTAEQIVLLYLSQTLHAEWFFLMICSRMTWLCGELQCEQAALWLMKWYIKMAFVKTRTGPDRTGRWTGPNQTKWYIRASTNISALSTIILDIYIYNIYTIIYQTKYTGEHKYKCIEYTAETNDELFVHMIN